MLKELVDFSRELENSGIYERIEKTQQKIDKPIMVIPVKDDLSDIDTDNIYFVVKDIEEEIIDGKSKRHLVFDGGKKVEIKKQENTLNFKSLEDEPKEWQQLYLNIFNLTNKVFGANKNIDRIGGISSYNILIFKLYKDENYNAKLEKTYDINKNNLHKYIQLKDKAKEGTLIKLLISLGKQDNRKIVNEIVSEFFSIIVIDSITLIIKIDEVKIYKEIYNYYLGLKSFAKEEKKFHIKYGKCICTVCKRKISEEESISLPDSFNSLNEKKEYLLHHNRITNLNTAVCLNCSLSLYKFREFFLNKLHISTFPLFIARDIQKYEISLIKSDLEKGIKKLSFKEIIKNIYNSTSLDVLDFYLIVCQNEGRGKDRKVSFLSLDFITGFQFKKNGKTVFEIENKLNDLFFDFQLTYNYFSRKVVTKSAVLDNLIYRYRTQIFDFVYRAKYYLSVEDINNLFYETLKRKLKECYDSKKEKDANITINKMKKHIYDLNKYFGGNFMQTVERIKKEKRVTNLESLSYYIGQAIYFLFTKSERKDKTHAMIEPFVNVTTFRTLGLKFEEIFSVYKHALKLNWGNTNQKLSDIWSFLYDNRKEKFTRDLKMLFYAGYFNTNENIFIENKKEGEKDV